LWALRYRARVAYDGSGFSGFQLQSGKDVRTVQGVLEAALAQRLWPFVDTARDRPVVCVGAGRTDTGVHAQGQAIHFEVDKVIQDDLNKVEYAINSMLPDDVCIFHLQPCPPPRSKTVSQYQGPMVTREVPWNALYESQSKTYVYRLSMAPTMHPLDRHTRWHPVWDKTTPIQDQIDRLQDCLQLYVGTHDWRAFAGNVLHLEQDGERLDTVRTVYNATLIHEEDSNYKIVVQLSGALYRMVRNLVGTAVDVARGQESMELIQTLLSEAPDRSQNPCKPAPPQGLTLEWIDFGEDEF